MENLIYIYIYIYIYIVSTSEVCNFKKYILDNSIALQNLH